MDSKRTPDNRIMLQKWSDIYSECAYQQMYITTYKGAMDGSSSFVSLCNNIANV